MSHGDATERRNNEIMAMDTLYPGCSNSFFIDKSTDICHSNCDEERLSVWSKYTVIAVLMLCALFY